MTAVNKRIYLFMIAGLAGGIAEIFWITIYSTVVHTNSLEISRQITASLIPAWEGLSIAPVLGIGIHLVLSVILALLCCTVFIEPLARYSGRALILPASLTVLACVWLINFFVILPVINPAFITLLPFLVTLASKMFFGWAMGSVLAKGYVYTANQSA